MADPTIKVLLELRDLAKQGLQKFENLGTEVSKSVEQGFRRVERQADRTGGAMADAGQRGRGALGGVVAVAGQLGAAITGIGTIVRGISGVIGGFVSLIRSGFRLAARSIRTVINLVSRVAQDFLGVSKELDQIAKTAVRVGITARALTELQLAANLTGTSMQALAIGIRTGIRNVDDYKRGAGEAKTAFEALGITQQEVNERVKSGGDLLELVAERFGNLGTEAERTAVSQRIFGRSGTELLPILLKGAEGIRELREEARRLGLSFSTEELAQVEAFNDAIARIQLLIQGVKARLLVDAAPALERFVTSIKDKLLEIRPEIIGTIQAIPEIARIAFDFIRDDLGFFATKVGEVLLEGFRFAFNELLVIAKAAFRALVPLASDAGFAIVRKIEEALLGSPLIASIQANLKTIGFLAETEFDKLVDEFASRGPIKLNPFEFITGRTPFLELGKEIEQFKDNFGRMVTAIRDQSGQIVEILRENLDTGVDEVLTPFGARMGDVAEKGVQALARFASEAKKGSREALVELKKNVKGIIAESNLTGQSIEDVAERIAGAWTLAVEAARRGERTAADSAAGAASKTASTLAAIVPKQVSGLEEVIRKLEEALALRHEEIVLGRDMTAQVVANRIQEEFRAAAIQAVTDGKRKSADLIAEEIALVVELTDREVRLLDQEVLRAEKLREIESILSEMNRFIELQDFGAGIGEGLRRAAEAFSPFNIALDATVSTFNALESGASRFLDSLFDKTKSAGDALKALGLDLLRILQQATIRSLFGGILEQIGVGIGARIASLQAAAATAAATLKVAGVAVATSMIAGATTAAGILAAGAKGVTPLLGGFPLAEGGILKGPIQATKRVARALGAPIRAMATGGFVTDGPTLVEVGEGSDEEAVIPMHGGRIPVELQVRGPKTAARPGNVFQLSFPSRVEISGGGVDREMIRQAMAEERARTVAVVEDTIRRFTAMDGDTVENVRRHARLAF